MATAFKIFRWAFVILLTFILALKIYLRLSFDVAMGSNETLTILGFIVASLFKKKLTWFLGILLFVGGLYNLVFVANTAAEATAMQFTHPLVRTFYDGEYRSMGAKLLGIIPDIFYIIGFFLFLTPHVRRLYWAK